MKNIWLISGLIITILGLILFITWVLGIRFTGDYLLDVLLSMIGFIMIIAGIPSIIVGFIFKNVEKNTDIGKGKAVKYKLILVVAIILLIFGFIMYSGGQHNAEQQDTYFGDGIYGDASATRRAGEEAMTFGSILLFFGTVALLYVVVSMIPKKSNLFSKRNCPKCGRKIPFDSKICPFCKHDFDE